MVPERGGIIIIPMATGIIRMHVREGFVIAADGIQTKDDNRGFSISFSKQKMFPIIEEPGIAGKITRVCIHGDINVRLNAAQRGGRFRTFPSFKSLRESERGETIVEMLIDRYYRGRPASVRTRFFHENQKLRPPEIISDTLDDMRVRFPRDRGTVISLRRSASSKVQTPASQDGPVATPYLGRPTNTANK